MSLEDELLDKVLSIQYDDLTPEVAMAGKKSIVDLIGVAIAGSTTPVALATAELCGKVSGRDFSNAIITGSEVMCRMRLVPDYCSGLSGWVGDVCGIFGGAITAGRLMKLDSEQTRNALSYCVGKMVVDKIPVFLGLPPDMSITQLKYLCAPLGVSAGTPMFHAVGITPEAPTVAAAFGGRKPEMTIAVGRREIDSTFKELCSATEPKVDYVFLGCPHVSIPENGGNRPSFAG